MIRLRFGFPFLNLFSIYYALLSYVNTPSQEIFPG